MNKWLKVIFVYSKTFKTCLKRNLQAYYPPSLPVLHRRLLHGTCSIFSNIREIRTHSTGQYQQFYYLKIILFHLLVSRRVKSRRAFRLSTWNKTCQVNKKGIVKERNKLKTVVFRVVCKTNNKEYRVTKHEKNIQLQAQFSPSGLLGRTGLFIKLNYQTTFLC